MLLSKLKLKAIQNRKAGRDLSRPAHFGLKRKQAKQMKFNYKGKAMVNVELRILVQNPLLMLCSFNLHRMVGLECLYFLSCSTVLGTESLALPVLGGTLPLSNSPSHIF